MAGLTQSDANINARARAHTHTHTHRCLRRQSCSNRVSSVRGFTVRPLDTLVRESPTYGPASACTFNGRFFKAFSSLFFSFFVYPHAPTYCGTIRACARIDARRTRSLVPFQTIEIANAFGLDRKSSRWWFLRVLESAFITPPLCFAVSFLSCLWFFYARNIFTICHTRTTKIYARTL